jgi:hypothetical protein
MHGRGDDLLLFFQKKNLKRECVESTARPLRERARRECGESAARVRREHYIREYESTPAGEKREREWLKPSSGHQPGRRGREREREGGREGEREGGREVYVTGLSSLSTYYPAMRSEVFMRARRWASEPELGESGRGGTCWALQRAGGR